MIELIVEQLLTQLPPDAPQMLTNFIAEQEQAKNGKLYVMLSQKVVPINGKQSKNVVVTIFCVQKEKTFVLPQYNNKTIKALIKEFEHQIPMPYRSMLMFFDVQAELNSAFTNMEKKKGQTRITIYNQQNEDGTLETIFEEKTPESVEKNTFEDFLKNILAQKK
jgi:hypothetical protein